jgi:hypothetical protein
MEFSICEGAMDGKHVQIEAPQNNGSIYYTSKVTVKVESLYQISNALKIFL